MKKLCKRLCFSIFCIVIFSMLTVGGYLYFSENLIKANYYLRIASDINDETQEGSTEAMKYYLKAIHAYEKSGHSKEAVAAYIDLGLLHYKLGNAQQVETLALKALAAGQDNIPPNLKAKVYLLMASTLEPEKAMEYISKSLEISKANYLNNLTAKAYLLQGKMYEFKAEFEDAEQSYKQAIDAAEDNSSIDDSFDISDVYDRLGELYAGGGQISEAIDYYTKALNYHLGDERGFLTANYMKTIGDLYKEKRNYVKACEMWEESRDEYAYFGAIAPFELSYTQNPYKPCDNLG